MNFADITEIVIPTGDVIKIQAQDGTVLWEKSANGKMPDNSYCFAVAYSNELRLFCAITSSSGGSNSHTLTSVDGIKWTKQSQVGLYGVSLNTRTNMLYIANQNGFVFGGDEGYYVVSSDGSVRGDSSLNGGLFGICYDDNNNIIYGIGNTYINFSKLVNGRVDYYYRTDGTSISCGCIAYSSELRTLTALASTSTGTSQCVVLKQSDASSTTQTWEKFAGPTGLWRSMCWSSKLKKFCAVGDGTNHVALSSDGKTWNAYAAPYENLTSVCWGEEVGLFCAVSRTNNVALTSKDGINWTEHNTPTGAWNSVCWSSRLKMFCAVGNTDNVFNLKV